MVNVVKLGTGQASVTRNQTTLQGITNVTTDTNLQTITFFTVHSSLHAHFDEISDKHGALDVKGLGEYYLANDYFLDAQGVGGGSTVDLSVLEASNAAIQIATEASAASLAVLETTTAGISTNTSDISTNTAAILLDTTAILLDTANIDTSTAGIKTDTGNIATDTANIDANIAGILADTSNIETSVSGIKTDTAAILLDTANIDTNTAAILADTAGIETNTTGIKSDTAAILLDTANIDNATAAISINTANIKTDTGQIATNTANIAASALLGATAANQTTGNNSLSSIDAKVALASKQDTQITLATTANTLLSQIQTNTAGGGGGGGESNIKLDVAGKVPTASIETDIDVKFRYDKQPLLFDEVIAGAGTSVHEPDNSSILLTVSANNQYVIRQSFERFNYQSGKPKVGTFTFVNIAPQAGTIKRVGLYNGGITAPYSVTDGVYMESDGTDVKVCAAFLGVVFSVAQSDWTDKLDGTGASGVTVDWTQSQILTIEYLWLGYGPIRFSLLVGESLINFHTINNGANTAAVPYMSSPNQPIRYEIRSTGGTGTFKQTCTTVGTSGGRDLLGIERGIDLGSAFENVNLAVLGTNYLVYASRLKSTSLDAQVKILSYEMLVTSNDDFIYYLIFNPTITGAVTYIGQSNSVTEIATGNGTQTVSGGTIISS